MAVCYYYYYSSVHRRNQVFGADATKETYIHKFKIISCTKIAVRSDAPIQIY